MAKMRGGIEVSGGFFERDPSLTFKKNVEKLMSQLADHGERVVKVNYPIGPTGEGRKGVVGRNKALSGHQWRSTMVVSETHVYRWPNGGPKQYRGGKTEARRHMFRRGKNDVRREAKRLTPGLLKGL